MLVAEAIKRLEHADAVRSSSDSTPADLREAIAATTGLQGFIDACRGELIRTLDRYPTAFAEAAISETTGCSFFEASKETERARTLGDAADMANALSDGTITAAHVDALTRAARNLDESVKTSLLTDPDLATAASRSSVRQFESLAKRKAKALDRSDPVEKFERQRRATSLKTFTDHEGMWNLHAKYDPLTGAKFAKRLQSANAATFAESTPHTAPSDPRDRSAHLNALALADIVLANSLLTHVADETDPIAGRHLDAATAQTRTITRPGAPLVVVDASQTDGAGGPIVDWGIPVEVPATVLTDMLSAEDPDVVVVANGVVLHATGRLDLGRTSRLANRAQRRALAGLYSTCAVPNCDTHVDRCRLHHVEHWEHGGGTDLANLLPICQHHHTLLHEDNWNVTLGENRELTIEFPDGQSMCTGPPRRGSP